MGELQLGGEKFDPSQPALRARLLTALGANAGATIEAVSGVVGGLNEGIWLLKGCGEDAVLKLVKYDARLPTEFAEADVCVRLHREHPNIDSDATVAFPYRILHLMGAGGARQYDLIAMPRAPGQALALTIADKWYSGKGDELMGIFRRIGACLAQFHTHYGGKQHGDFHSNNIFYDDATGAITFIDIAGMGCKTTSSDREHLTKTIVQVSACYGEKLREAVTFFENGYAQAAGGKCSRLGGA